MADITQGSSTTAAATAADDDAVRVLVHDLRGQLSTLLSAARLLELSAGDISQAREVVEIIRRQVEALDRKIGQLGRAKSGSAASPQETIDSNPADVPANQLETQGAPLQSSQQALRVLVVDDDRAAAHLLSRLLTRLGCEVKSVNSGEAALEALADFAPQAVITDQEMPAMKGNELARRIRSGSAPWPVLIALSGYEAGSSQSPDLASDFDHVLSKPAGLEALERLLASIAAASN